MSIVLELQKEAMKSDKDILTILRMALMLEKNGVLGDDLTFTKEEIEIAKTSPQIINYVNTTIINGNVKSN